MRLAWTYYLWSSIIQRTVGRADRLHARKQSVDWPRHSNIADYYLQSVVYFRCLLHYYDEVYIYICLEVNCRLPGMLFYWLPLHIITRVSSVGNVNTRLPVAVKPTSMHVLVSTYEGPIYGRPLVYTTAVSYSTMMICIRYVLLSTSTVLTRILRGGALSTISGMVSQRRRRDGQDSLSCPAVGVILFGSNVFWKVKLFTWGTPG